MQCTQRRRGINHEFTPNFGVILFEVILHHLIIDIDHRSSKCKHWIDYRLTLYYLCLIVYALGLELKLDKKNEIDLK